VTSRRESSDMDRTSTPTASVEMARLVRRCSVLSNVRSSESERHAASYELSSSGSADSGRLLPPLLLFPIPKSRNRSSHTEIRALPKNSFPPSDAGQINKGCTNPSKLVEKSRRGRRETENWIWRRGQKSASFISGIGGASRQTKREVPVKQMLGCRGWEWWGFGPGSVFVVRGGADVVRRGEAGR
jgi:hypothetical protein